MRIGHFKLRNIRRYAAYLGHCTKRDKWLFKWDKWLLSGV